MSEGRLGGGAQALNVASMNLFNLPNILTVLALTGALSAGLLASSNAPGAVFTVIVLLTGLLGAASYVIRDSRKRPSVDAGTRR